jgi:glycosyltransferase involved in cell wall biosynthesis
MASNMIKRKASGAKTAKARAKKQAKVTVCAPVYNGGEYFRKMLRSVLDQDHGDFEVLVIDNCSTDKTPEIERSVKDSRVRYVRNEKNLGACGNWNRCLELAKGEYIAIFHCDDLYYKDMVSNEVEFLDKNPDSAAVFTSADIISADGGKLGELNLPPEFEPGKVKGTRDIVDFTVSKGYEPLICPTFMVRRKAAMKCGFFDCRNFLLAFDMDYYFRLLDFGTIGFLKQRLMGYRKHGTQGSLRYNDMVETQDEHFRILDEAMKKHGIRLDEGKMARFQADRRFRRTIDAMSHAYFGNRKRALELSKSSFRPADALLDFPSPKRIVISCFELAFLLSQYVFAGKPFAGLFLWLMQAYRRHRTK